MGLRNLTIERVMFVTLFALIFAMATRIPIDTDTWWHIRSGEYILTNGTIYADPFSHTFAGEPWVNHSWGSQIVMTLVWRAGGNAGLALYTAVLATAGMAMVYRVCSGNVYVRAFVLVLGAATAAVFWSARPQMISFFLSTVILYLLYSYKREKIDRLWLIPVVILLWGNLHAGFSIAFIFLGGFVAGEVMGNLFGGADRVDWRGLRKVILVSVASVGALVINPYGLEMLKVPFATVSIGALQDFIQEWNSPNFHERQTWPFVFMIVAMFGAAGASRKKLDWTDFILAAGTMFMGLLAGRNIAVYAVVAPIVITRHLADALTERGWVIRPIQKVNPRMARINAILLTIILFGVMLQAVAILLPESVDEAQREYLPVAAAEYLNENNPPGPMFNSYNWGGYLMLAAPQYPVFVDGRTDLYGNDFLREYLSAAVGGDNWRDLLAEYGINLVVVETNSGLALNLRAEPGWRVAYSDDMATILVREDES